MKRIIVMMLAFAMLAVSPLAFADEDEMVYDISSEVVFDGLNLTGNHSDDDVEMTFPYQNDDGTNFVEYIIDSIAVVSYERLNATSGSNEALAAVNALAEAQGIMAQDMTITDTYEVNDDVNAATYTVYRIEYMTGSNEDACNNVDVYYEGADWAYRFHAQIPADFYQDYSEKLEGWIANLTISDATAPAYYENSIIDDYAHFDMQNAEDQTELVDYEEYSDISYSQTYLYDGGVVTYSFERYTACSDGDDVYLFLAADVYASKTDEELTMTEDDDLTARLSYPAYRIEYMTGSNEDTCQNMDVAALLDDCTLLFHVSASLDNYEEYQSIIEGWIDALEIVDAAAAE